MSTERKTRTMYAHTLDGKLMNYVATIAQGGPALRPHSRHGNLSLVSSITRLHCEQLKCRIYAEKPLAAKRYGYVLVEVPR